MKRFYTYHVKCICTIIVTIFYLQGHSQVIPANQDFSTFGAANPISGRLNNISLTASPLNFAYISPATVAPGGLFGYVGLAPDGQFRPGDKAYFFNYTTGGAIPGLGQSGGGDYRISFSAPGDTTKKAGNFWIRSMYLAIGAGNTSDVRIQGFRAGKIVAEADITGLTSSSGITDASSDDLSYTNSDAYGGLNIQFGDDWKFLDGIRFLIPSANIPLAVDDLIFNNPDYVAPGTQASAIGFANTTGVSSKISWTPGTGDSVLVFMAATNSGAASPVVKTFYHSNSTFGSGDEAGTGWFCVYRGADAGVNPSTSVYGLTPGTTYKAMVVSFNGALNWEDYQTTVSTNANTFTTIAIPATQASNIEFTTDYTDFRKVLISWTRGDGAKSAVFVRNNTSSTDATVAPLNNNMNADAAHHTYTPFTDSVSVTTNGRVTSSAWYCVFNGSGNGTGLSASVSMSRISIRPGQTLRVMVVEYNGTAGAETYNTTSASANVSDYFNPDFPLPVTNAATGITTSGATFNGSIDPRRANITSGRYYYSTNPSLTTVLGTITTLTPAATSILGTASPTPVAGIVTGLSPSTTYYYILSAASNAGTFTATNNTGGATNGIRSFTTAPVVNSVSATTANGSYKAGQVITVTVGFTSAVTVTGIPTITLNSGAVVNYTSGSGTTTLNFNYTIAGGQTSADLDYTTTAALLLAGGTIKDIDGTDALLTLPTVGGANSLGGQKNIIIDTQTPFITTAAIVSNNVNATLAKPGNIVTLNFTSNETIQTPVVSIAGNTASVTNTSNNDWTATYTLTTSDADGIVPFSITFADIAANAGTTAVSTTNNSSVLFDKTAPSLTTVSIASNNTNTSFAKTGNSITVSFTSNEIIVNPSVTIRGNAASVTNTAGNTWTAVYTMVAGDESGVIPFSITFTDVTGNTGTAVTSTTNSSSVRFDRTVPSLTTVTIASNNSNTALAKTGNVVTLNFTATETISTPVVTIAGNAAVISNTSANNWMAVYTMKDADAAGSVSFNITFADLAGNAGTAVSATTNSSTVVFDKSAPSLTSISISSNNNNTSLAKTGNIITLSFTANKTIITPVVTIAGNVATVTNTSGNNWTAVYTLKDTDAAGTIAFSISFADVTGNTGVPATATTDNSSVVFDKSTVTVGGLSFTGGNTITSGGVCINAADKNISSLLQVTGASTGATVIWTVVTQPAHGTLSGFPVSVTATAATVTPAGLLYKPASGYSGTDAFVISVSNGSSSITSTVNISISPAPVSSITTTQGTILCGAAATLVIEATGGNSYAWFNNGTLIPSATGAQLTLSAVGTYTVTATNASGCSAAAGNNVTVTQVLKPTAAYSFNGNCINKAINFTNQSVTTNSGSVTYLWSDGTNTSTSASPVFTYTVPGNYNIKLTVTPTACPDIAENVTKAISIQTPPVGVRMPPVNTTVNTNTTLQARGFGNTYSWAPAGNLTNANTAAPTANITKEQEYTITIETLPGCITVDTLLVRIFTSAGIILPNVFTPNGDGVNDMLLPNLVDVKVFQYFRVFNRSGKKVFESNDPTRGWDGKVNGERQPAGTYMWSAAGLDKNGVLVHKEGSITILR